MKVTLWGVRGSIPTPMTTSQYQTKLKSALRRAAGQDLSDDQKLEDFVQGLPREEKDVVGGNTTCISVSDDETLIVFDAGSGIRLLGQKLMAGGFAKGHGAVNIFFSHHHHDHTCGFPFFIPAYIPGNEMHFFGAHEKLDERMIGLQVQQYFPVPFNVMASKKFFHPMECAVPLALGEFTITATELNHPGIAFGYRVEWKDKVFVFASDSEYKNPSDEEIERFVKFFSNADLLYFDGQYTLQEAFVKENWGHSSSLVGVDFAVQANVKTLLIGHHEPLYADDVIMELERQAAEYRNLMYPDSTLQILTAIEGDVFDFSQ